jgi:hypothetical protein
MRVVCSAGKEGGGEVKVESPVGCDEQWARERAEEAGDGEHEMR